MPHFQQGDHLIVPSNVYIILELFHYADKCPLKNASIMNNESLNGSSDKLV